MYLNSNGAIQTIWEYEVKTEYLLQFKNTYGPDGDWAKLFRNCPGYLKTDLKCDVTDPNRFLTFDFWRSYAEYLAMKELIAEDYTILDKLCDAYTRSEKHIGIFEI